MKLTHYYHSILRLITSICLLGLMLLTLLISGRTGPAAVAQSPTATPVARFGLFSQ